MGGDLPGTVESTKAMNERGPAGFSDPELPPPPPLSGPASRWALFLDADGVLLEIAAQPELARASPAAIEALGACQTALGGALAVVSGRPIGELKRLFAPLDLAWAGLHGMEWVMPGGSLQSLGPANGHMAQIKPAAVAFADAHPGVLVEDKGRTLALHTRGAPEHEAAAVALANDLAAQLGNGYEVMAGKRVMEIKPAGVDKGVAVTALLAMAPFAGRTPVFAGDDVTDEAGFAVAEARGGMAVRVGAAPNGRATAARYQCRDVDAMVAWLAALGTRLQ